MNSCTRIIIFLFLIFVSCTRSQSPVEPILDIEEQSKELVLTLKFDESTADAVQRAISSGQALSKSCEDLTALEDLLANLGATSITRSFPFDPRYEERQRREGLHRFYRLTLDSQKQSATKALDELESISGVESVNIPQNRRRCSEFPFNDPMLDKQWNFINSGSLVSGHLPGADIDIKRVWEKYTTGNKNVVVAVVDGGIDLTHPDLAPVVLSTGEGGSQDFCNNDGSITPDKHGTHVAGLIAAVNNNAYGISSVAGGNDGSGGVRLMSCQIFVGKRTGNTAEAIVWACNNGALICNNSWGYDYNSQTAANMGGMDEEDKAAIDYFIKYAGCDNEGNQLPDSPMKGGLVVFAAGNSDFYDAYPAAYEPVVAVSAVGPSLLKAPYSNYGETVDICAPGGDYSIGNSEKSRILSTSPMDPYYSSEQEAEFCYLQGTSMACPQVSGVAALLLSYYGGSGFTCDDLKERLLRGANPIATINSPKKIGPLLDAYGSFVYDKDYLSNDIDLKPIIDGRNVSFSVKLPPESEAVYIALSTDASLLEGFDPFAAAKDSVIVISAKASQEDSVKLSTPLQMFREYHATAVVTDRNRYSKQATCVAFQSGGNYKPVVQDCPYILLDSIGRVLEIPLDTLVKDPDGDALDFDFALSNDSVVQCEKKDNSLILTALTAGRVQLSINATDPHGESVSASTTIVARQYGVFADIYPMPASTQINISTAQAHGLDYIIYSRGSAPVLKGSISSSILAPGKIDISSLIPGIYTLRLIDGAHKYEYQIVKIR